MSERNRLQHHADLDRDGDAQLVHGLRHERDRRARAARRARRPQAGAPPHPVRAARPQQRLEPAVPQVRAHRRRRDRQVPPARRQRGLRRARPHGPGLLDALHARRRPGQLRLGRRRSAGGHALHRVPDEQARRPSCSPTSTRRPSTGSRTTTTRSSSRRSCRPRFRTSSSTARTGIAVGMATNIPPHNLGEIIDGVLALIAQPEAHRRRARQARPRPRLPDRRRDPGPRRHPVGATRPAAARSRCAASRTSRRSARTATRSSSPSCRSWSNKARWIEATAEMVRDKKLEGISDIRDESRPHRHPRRVRAQARRERPGRAREPVQVHRAADRRSRSTCSRSSTAARCCCRCARALQVFIEHRREVVTRRTLFDLREARARREIVEGLGLAVINIDRVIEIIRVDRRTPTSPRSA